MDVIFYVFLVIALFQLALLGANLYQLDRRRRSIRRYSGEIARIVPEMRIHPNPLFGELMKTMGESINREERDSSWRMLGSILNSYEILLNKNVKHRVVFEESFIKQAQDNMSELRSAFEQDDKALYADFAFGMSCLLFESFQESPEKGPTEQKREPTEQDYGVTKELERTLLDMAQFLSERRKRYEILEAIRFRPWDDKQLAKADPHVRFLYFHIMRWCYELPFHYELYGSAYYKKSKQIAAEICKGLECAKAKNTVCTYLVLSKTYSSLFPRKKVELSAESAFDQNGSKGWWPFIHL